MVGPVQGGQAGHGLERPQARVEEDPCATLREQHGPVRAKGYNGGSAKGCGAAVRPPYVRCVRHTAPSRRPGTGGGCGDAPITAPHLRIRAPIRWAAHCPCPRATAVPPCPRARCRGCRSPSHPAPFPPWNCRCCCCRAPPRDCHGVVPGDDFPKRSLRQALCVL